jgi:hypothetical protein
MPRKGLLPALQVLDFGRNNFSLVLAIVSAVAGVQVAIDPDEPAHGAFLDYFLGQFPEGGHGVPLDVFFFAKLALGRDANEAALSLAPKKAASAPRLPVRITTLCRRKFLRR